MRYSLVIMKRGGKKGGGGGGSASCYIPMYRAAALPSVRAPPPGKASDIAGDEPVGGTGIWSSDNWPKPASADATAAFAADGSPAICMRVGMASQRK